MATPITTGQFAVLRTLAVAAASHSTAWVRLDDEAALAELAGLAAAGLIERRGMDRARLIDAGRAALAQPETRPDYVSVALPPEAAAELRALIEEVERVGIPGLPSEARALVPVDGDRRVPFAAGRVVGYACAVMRRSLAKKAGG